MKTGEFGFATDAEAKEFVRNRVDRPIKSFTRDLGDGIVLNGYTEDLDDGVFTNIYDLSFPRGAAKAEVRLHDSPTSLYDYIQTVPKVRGATSGGFFFLADQASTSPRQPSLNFAMADGRLRSLPVSDREALISDGRDMSAHMLQALGELTLDDTTHLTWAGSLTDHTAEAYVYGNGNSVIEHMSSDSGGKRRVLAEDSRYTTPIEGADLVDVGFVSTEEGTFRGVTSSTSGGIDIFAHDIVLRTDRRHIGKGDLPQMRVRSVGSIALDGSVQGGLSTGPMITTEDFTNHAVNFDRSLGSEPPLADRPIARTAVYETEDERVHMRIFDGRPGSEVFSGVTPTQAARLIMAEKAIRWGCFMDSGQTSKLVVADGGEIASFGSRHYLRWPQKPGDQYVWVPEVGRPLGSAITIR